MPILAVEPAPPLEKELPPVICPLYHGGLTGTYLTKTENAIDQWEEQRRPQNKNVRVSSCAASHTASVGSLVTRVNRGILGGIFHLIKRKQCSLL